tara:strand:- start:960 stop:2636 length:1677 start_codon:yes stop_codon:yes gene_type:complete
MIKQFKRLSFVCLIVAISFFGLLRSQQLDIYREIARSQQQIMTVYKYLVTEYIHELDIPQLTSKMINSMLENFDPYTEYYEEKDLEDLNIKTTGEFSGVGLQIYMYEGQLTVVGPIEGSPAFRAGIFTGDKITHIDGVSTDDMELKDATNLIRGEKGTDVVLTIKKPITDAVHDYTINRDVIAIKDIPYYGMVDPAVGYLRITNFSENTPKEAANAFLSLMDQGAENLIIDLRDNPGGLLSSSLDMLDLMLPKGLDMVSTKGRTGRVLKDYKSLNRTLLSEDIDITVLINEGSASASEIVAGVLQDHDRAVIVGSKSFGKGLVQSVIAIDNTSALKITNSKYYIPSGRGIQKREYIDKDLLSAERTKEDSLFTTKGGRKVLGGGGITPDILVENDEQYPLANAIYRDGGFFRFAQQTSDQYTSFEEVSNDSELMNKFADFIKENDIAGYVDGENELEKAKEKLVKEENKNIFLNNAFSVIENQIKKSQSAMLEAEKDFIEKMLLGWFAFYYEGDKGRYKFILQDDKGVQKSLEILLDDKLYTSILSVPEEQQIASVEN